MESASDDGEARRFSILVVDDEPENAEFLQRIFRRGYEVDMAHTGMDAVEALGQRPYDVIITDQMMPGMTGTELLTRSLALAPDAVRILVTGYPDLDNAIVAINDGRVSRFFAKPIRRKELMAAVEAELARIVAADGLRTRVKELEAENAELRAELAELRPEKS